MVACGNCGLLLDHGLWPIHARNCVGDDPEILAIRQQRCGATPKGHVYAATQKGIRCQSCCFPKPGAHPKQYRLLSREVRHHEYLVNAASPEDAKARLLQWLAAAEGTPTEVVIDSRLLETGGEIEFVLVHEVVKPRKED